MEQLTASSALVKMVLQASRLSFDSEITSSDARSTEFEAEYLGVKPRNFCIFKEIPWVILIVHYIL